MADATQQQRLVIPVGTQADVEDESASLGEALLAIDSSGEIIGYSTDGGTTWVWPSGGSTSLPSAVDGHGLFYDGSTLKTAQSPEPLLLEDGSLAVLENGHVAMSEPTFD